MVLLYSECHLCVIFNHVTLQIVVISLYLCQIHIDMNGAFQNVMYHE